MNEIELKLNEISDHISIYDYDLKLNENEISDLNYENENDYEY